MRLGLSLALTAASVLARHADGEILAIPAGFTAPTNEVTYTRAGATYSHNYVPLAELPASYSYTIYVNPVSGNDASATPSNSSTPYKTLNKAWLQVCSGGTLNGGAPFNITQTVLISLILTADYVGSGTAAGAFNGGNSTTIPTTNVFIRNTSGFRYSAVNATSSVTPVWTSPAANIYKCTTYTTAATADQLFDFDPAKRWFGVHPRTGASLNYVPSFAFVGTQLANAADEATALANLASAASGSWCLVAGTGVYYKTNRDLTVAANGATVRLSNTTSVGLKASRTGGTLYVEKVDIFGGAPTAFSTLDNTAGVGRIVLNQCVVQGSGTGDCCSVTGKFNMFLYRVAAANSYGDTFGYHAVTTGTNQQPNVPHGYELECVSVGAGLRHPAGTNNGSSAHDGAYVDRCNSVYYGGSGRVVGDTIFAQGRNIGLCIGPSIQDNADDYNLAVSNGAANWNEGVDIVTAPNAAGIQAMQVGAQLLFRHSPVDFIALAGASPGTIAAY